MNRTAFDKYLQGKHFSPATIRNYCSYVERFELDFGMSADDIVHSDETMARVFNELPVKLNVSPNCFSSYARGLRVYYEFKNGRCYDDGGAEQTSQAEVFGDEKFWYKEVRVSDVNEWWQFIRELNRGSDNCRNAGISDPRCWAFRGQGDAAWSLVQCII